VESEPAKAPWTPELVIKMEFKSEQTVSVVTVNGDT
jgi:hypothetical protein